MPIIAHFLRPHSITLFAYPFSVFILLATALLCSKPAQAASINAFDAVYNVHALGMTLGVSKHRFRCEQTQCTLQAVSKPQGLAKLLINEQSEETIKLAQTQNTLRWLSYQKKYGPDLSNPSSLKTQTFYLSDQLPNQVYNPKRQKSWPVQPQLYDSISLAYAVQFNVLNKKPLNGFFLQDRKRQEAIKFIASFYEVDLTLDNGQTYSKTPLFEFQSLEADIKVWLLTEYDFFPARVDVYNRKQNKTVTLLLQEPPKML